MRERAPRCALRLDCVQTPDFIGSSHCRIFLRAGLCATLHPSFESIIAYLIFAVKWAARRSLPIFSFGRDAYCGNRPFTAAKGDNLVQAGVSPAHYALTRDHRNGAPSQSLARFEAACLPVGIKTSFGQRQTASFSLTA